MSCTMTIAPTMPPSTSFTSRRSYRALSSPVPSPNGSGFRSQHSSPSHSPAPSRVIPPSDSAISVSMIAALPSLSKSLNHLPSLAGHPEAHIPVYEGMPSVAQKMSHEKLRAALGKECPSTKASVANQKMGYYASSLFSMTPVHSGPHSAPQMTSSSSKKSSFRLYAEDDDEEEVEDYE